MAIFNLVNKNELLKKLNTVSKALGYPTSDELAQKAREIAEEKRKKASNLTKTALGALATAEEKHQKAYQAADQELAMAQVPIKVDLETAASLTTEAEDIDSAASYISEQ